MKKATMLLLVCMIPFFNRAQWNQDLSQNTSVNNLSGSFTIKQNVTTPSGITYIAYTDFYHPSGVNRLYLQMFDRNGNKILGDDGISLGEVDSDFSSLDLFLKIDSAENCYISYRFAENDSKLYKVTNTGQNLFPGGVVTGDSDDWIYSLELTNEEDILILGKTWIKKYSSNLQLIWEQYLWNLPEFNSEGMWSGELKTDDSGSFYALMGIYQPGTDVMPFTNYFIQKYNESGQPEWPGLIPVNNDQSFAVYSSAEFDRIGHLNVINGDAIVTLPLIYNNSKRILYGQRFSSSNGSRMWNENILPMVEISAYEASADYHKTCLNKDNNQLYIAMTAGKLSLDPSPTEITSVIFQRINLLTGNRLNSEAGTELIPLSGAMPYSLTLDRCNDEIIMDVIYSSLQQDSLLSIDNMISLYKINELGEVNTIIPVKTSQTPVRWMDNTQGMFSMDAQGQAVVVFADRRIPGNFQFGLYAQNVQVCELGLSEVDQKDLLNIQVFPNPARNILNFEFYNTISSLEIYTPDGKSMIENKEETKSLKVDISTWKNGIYIYNITDQKGIRSNGKFVKE